jgi:hypothetical protein
MFHTIEQYDFIPNEVGFTLEMSLFIPKLNNSYARGGESAPLEWTFTLTLRPVQTTQMAHTHTGKPELVSVVCENLCISLDVSRCLDVHNTGASPPYNPLVLRSPPPTRNVCDPRVHKLTVTGTSMTRVVNGVCHTSLCDTLTRGKVWPWTDTKCCGHVLPWPMDRLGLLPCHANGKCWHAVHTLS